MQKQQVVWLVDSTVRDCIAKESKHFQHTTDFVDVRGKKNIKSPH